MKAPLAPFAGLANPVVALRNALPSGLLTGLGLIPYRLGASCGPRRLRGLQGWERLAGWPTRFLTRYFLLALRARKAEAR